MKKNALRHGCAGFCMLIAALFTFVPQAAAVSPMAADVDLDADTINLDSHGKWITAYIELTTPGDAGNIEAGTVTLLVNGNEIPAEPRPMKVGDYDEDGVPDLMVKFDRQILQSHLFMGAQTLTVSGEIVGGVAFEGSDTINGYAEWKGPSPASPSCRRRMCITTPAAMGHLSIIPR